MVGDPCYCVTLLWGTVSILRTGPAVIGSVVVRVAEISNLTRPYVLGSLEPLTGWLQEVRPHAMCALAALMTRVIALMALAALGLTEAPVHEPVHVEAPAPNSSYYCA